MEIADRTAAMTISNGHSPFSTLHSYDRDHRTPLDSPRRPLQDRTTPGRRWHGEVSRRYTSGGPNPARCFPRVGPRPGLLAVRSLHRPRLHRDLQVYGGQDKSNPTVNDIEILKRIIADFAKDFTICLFPKSRPLARQRGRRRAAARALELHHALVARDSESLIGERDIWRRHCNQPLPLASASQSPAEPVLSCRVSSAPVSTPPDRTRTRP